MADPLEPEIGIREVLQQVDARMGALERQMGERVDRLEGRVEELGRDLRREMVELRHEMMRNLRFTSGLVLTSWVTIMATLIIVLARI